MVRTLDRLPGLVLATALAAATCAAADLADGLAVYCPFEGKPEASVIVDDRLQPPWPSAFTEGLHGQGLLVDGSAGGMGLSYPCAYNMKNSAGTVAFWIKPTALHEPPATGEKLRVYFSCTLHDGSPALSLYWTTKYGGSIWFASGVTVDGEWRWIWSPVWSTKDWSVGRWYHLAVTWRDLEEGGERALYVDGRRVAGERFPRGKHAHLSEGHCFNLGSSGPATRPDLLGLGVYDDLCIWQRALAPEEIRGLADGTSQARLESATPDPGLPSPRGLPTVSVSPGVMALALAERPGRLLRRARVLTDNDLGIVGDGEPFRLQLEWELEPGAAPAAMELRVTDLWGKPAGQPCVLQRPAATGTLTEPLELRPGRRGVFRVSAAVSTAMGEAQSRDLITFAVLPKALADLAGNPDAFLGTHAWWEDYDWHARAARRLGFAWTRLHDADQSTWWVYIEPREGDFRFKDSSVDAFRGNGLSILGLLEATPAWASRYEGPVTDPVLGPHTRYPPRDWAAYERYVRRTVEHYKDRIHAWEVWNEPNWSGFWRGTPAEYAKLSEITYRAIKEVDPAATVVGFGGGAGAAPWFEQVLQAGALQHCDAVSFHYYAGDESPRRPDPEHDRSATWRALMQRYGAEKPLWNTEESAGVGSFHREYQMSPDEDADVRRSAALTARKLVVNYAAGVQKIFLYDLLRRGQKGSHYQGEHSRLLEYYGSPHPAAVAAATVANLLTGTEPAGRLDTDAGLVVCLFRRPRSGADTALPLQPGAVAAVMVRSADSDQPARTLSLSGPQAQGLTVVDMTGGVAAAPQGKTLELAVSAEPLFILAPRMSAELLRQRLVEGSQR
jgi:hypothetical protein